MDSAHLAMPPTPLPTPAASPEKATPPPATPAPPPRQPELCGPRADPPTRPMFVYGPLLADELLSTVLLGSRDAPNDETVSRRARVYGYEQHGFRELSHCAAVETRGRPCSVEGLLVLDPTEEQRRRVVGFHRESLGRRRGEEEGYELKRVVVRYWHTSVLAGTSWVEATMLAWRGSAREALEEVPGWDLGEWEREFLAEWLDIANGRGFFLKSGLLPLRGVGAGNGSFPGYQTDDRM